MTKKLWVADNNEGNGRGCRPGRPNRPRKMDAREVDDDVGVCHLNCDIYMTKIGW